LVSENISLTIDFTSSSQLKRWGPSSVPLVLVTGGNHLEPDLGYKVDAAAQESPSVELHLLLLQLCEAWRCRIEEVFNFSFQSVRFFILMK